MPTLTEYSTLTLPLAAAHLPALRRLISHLPATALTLDADFTPGHVRLTAGPWVGLLPLPTGDTLHLTPRWPLPAVLQRLAELYLPPAPAHVALPPTPIPPTSATLPGWLSTMVTAFCAAADTTRRYGVRRPRQPETTTGQRPTGRLDLTASLHHQARHPTEHVYTITRPTLNTPENRRIAHAATRALAAPDLPPTLRARLRDVLTAFGGPPAAPPDPAPIAIHRLNQHYRPALALADLLINHLLPTTAPGKMPTHAFLIHLPWLFERTLAHILRTAAPDLNLRIAEQERHPFDLARSHTLRPDLVIYRGPDLVLVLDAKYKPTPDPADLYQVLAYCQSLNLRQAALVYPALPGADPLPPLTLASGITLHRLTLDLAAPDFPAERQRLLATLLPLLTLAQ